MVGREGVRVWRDQESDRKAALNSGERWTLAQAARSPVTKLNWSVTVTAPPEV